MLRSIVALSTFLIFLHAQEASQWGENVSGVATRFQTHKKQVALTLDACGGSPRSSQYDKELIDFLIQHKIPATLFINARWIDSNPAIFKELSSNPLFEIANHGTRHRPLSISGKSVYGIEGTHNSEEVIDEIKGNEEKIFHLTGKRPRFFRSGTAYYDEIAVKTAHEHGVDIGGFAIVADAGATLGAEEVERRISSASAGDIIIAHMNHPESGTREGIIHAVHTLQESGFEFVRLSEVKEHLIKIP